MTSFFQIPKILQPRDTEKYFQRIPKIIWQTMNHSLVPEFIKTYSDSWIEKNPEYTYHFYDDNDILKFIEQHYPEYLNAYLKINYGASKADLWRYLVMYKFGGVYSDIDCNCIVSLRDWINPEAAYVSQLGINRDLCQWLLISEPGNPVFLQAAQMTMQNIEKRNYKTSYRGFEYTDGKISFSSKQKNITINHKILGLSGPPVLQAAAEICYQNGAWETLLPHLNILCVSDKVSCQMGGNVSHDSGHEGYLKSLSRLHTSYYNSMYQRIKRFFGG